ncbi:phosphatidylinositol N-acetylglucosaminyltransferase subunit P-like [Ylistrum balloti]|uniref:phosphatidylinositol N-acetylglucosaminyltransferase subunit P-like n=1 Tax=Ylistrum balloti TaxID=509963 RepID=UPI002905B662|nr:phosphatidylinositol N-acetylglucosaminyltransferase subunit P-like [Ylistrum balloti]
MPEHSPSPTPERAIYGFVLYLLAFVLFFLYLVWAWVPDAWLHQLGLDYWPQKQWAIALPTFLCFCLLMSYPVYFGLTFLNSPPLTSREIIKDSHTIMQTDTRYQPESIPPLIDLSITEVNKRLYLHDPDTPMANK